MSLPMEKPEIRIWIFNNPIRGITEQLDFLSISLRQQGYKVSVSNRPSTTGLNILIENLNENTFPIVEKFACRYKKRLAVVMTEHVDFVGGKIFFHGLPFSAPSEYMHALTRRARLLHLLLSRNHIRYFIRLGDLPDLNGLDNMICDIPVLTLPFPKIEACDRASADNSGIDYDLVFSGMLTSYRRTVLEKLKMDFNILVLEKQVSRRCRDAANASAKAVINIPQDTDWPWISTMRILAAWRCGRPVVNVGSGQKGELADFCFNVSDSLTGKNSLIAFLKTSQDRFSEQIGQYHSHIESAKTSKFPEVAFRIWGLTELGHVESKTLPLTSPLEFSNSA